MKSQIKKAKKLLADAASSIMKAEKLISLKENPLTEIMGMRVIDVTQVGDSRWEITFSNGTVIDFTQLGEKW